MKLKNSLFKLAKLALIFSVTITGWTTIILVSNTNYDLEIKKLITKMYVNQKNFIFNIKDLSILLVKDANERISDENQFINSLNNAKK